MNETLTRTIKENKRLLLCLLVLTAFLANVIPLHLQADDETGAFETVEQGGNEESTSLLNAFGDEPTQEHEMDEQTLEDEEPFYYIEERFLEEHTWLFYNQNDESPIGRISNETIWIVEKDRDWLKVVTKDQEGWVNLAFTPCTDELDELLSQFGSGLSVYFENMETGFSYSFNEEQMYPSASVKKAVHGLFVYQRAEQGLIDLGSSPWGATCPTQSVREFVSRNIRVSCDHATFVLLDWFGLSDYLDFIEELGANRTLIGSWVINSQLTVEEASIFVRAIYEYMESDGSYSAEFRDHLLNNEYPFIVSDYPVASKTGWYPPHAWHDMAIVYAPSPYALIILSARHGWSERDYEDFRIISMAFQEFNDRWFF